MKTIAVYLPVFILLLSVNLNGLVAQDSSKDAQIKITTEYGEMLVKLYDETPQHRDNFLKLVSENFYDSLLFHRVINKFMIQGGDPNSKNAAPGQPLGQGGLDYRVPAEIHPDLYHKKGALAAARQSDQVNPEKKSSACQFYIVQGKINPSNILQSLESRKQQYGNPDFEYPETAFEDYNQIGGTPHLDGEYTVFGEVVQGLEVIDKIAAVEVDGRSRPIEDVVMKIELIK